MFAKISFAILGSSLVLFLIGRVDGLLVAQGADGAVAWAQESTQDADDAAQNDSGGGVIQSEPSKKSPPPAVAGPWCGSIEDTDLGPGTISLEVNQKGANLSGSWSDTLGGSGTFKGKIKGDAITATLKQRDTKCKVAMVGLDLPA